MIPETLLARLRHEMNNEFTTSDFKDNALNYGVSNSEAQDALNYMIKRDFINRTKVGHYKKTNRYYGEQ